MQSKAECKVLVLVCCTLGKEIIVFILCGEFEINFRKYLHTPPPKKYFRILGSTNIQKRSRVLAESCEQHICIVDQSPEKVLIVWTLLIHTYIYHYTLFFHFQSTVQQKFKQRVTFRIDKCSKKQRIGVHCTMYDFHNSNDTLKF